MTRGERGEELAAAYFIKEGYAVTGRNVRSRYGEIDLIAEKDGIAVFVEVKLRKDKSFAEAREFVDARKQEKIRTTALVWLARKKNRDKQGRFDVIEIYAAGDTVHEINHLENAFE